MTRRSDRPSDPHNRNLPRGSSVRGEPRAATSRSEPTAVAERSSAGAGSALAAGALLIAYAVLFFTASPLHASWLALPLVPDALVANWFGASFASCGVLDRLPVLLGAALILTIAGVAGRWGLEIVGLAERLTRAERALFGVVAGLPAIGLFTLLTGLAGWLHRPTLVAVAGLSLLGLLAATAVVLQRRRRKFGAFASVAPDSDAPAVDSTGDAAIVEPERWSWSQRGLAAIVGGLSAFIVAGGMLPPWEFDVREYHLQAPKEWWQAGRIEFLPHNIYANMPMNAEMPALLATVFWPGEDGWWGGALTGKTVIAATIPLTAGLLIVAGLRLGSRSAGLVAAALYLTTPWTAHLGTTGLIDGTLGCYLLATVLAAAGWAEERSSRAGGAGSAARARSTSSAGDASRASVVGWLAGAAAACKYPGLAFAVAPAAIGLCILVARRKVAGSAVLALAAAVALSAGPWYLKNAVQTGNPTYPLFSSLFGAGGRTAEQDRQWRDAHRQRDSAGRTYSWNLLFSSAAQVGWRSDWSHPAVAPLAAIGAAAGCFGRRRRAGLQMAAATTAWVLIVWWAAGHRIDRFWLPILPLLAGLAGWATVLRQDRGWQAAVGGATAFGLMIGGLATISPGAPDNPLGDVRLFVRLDELRRINRHPLQDSIERSTPPGGRLLLVGDAQPFPFSIPVLYSTCFDESPLKRFLAPPDVSGRRRAFAAEQVTHVAVAWSEIARYRQPGNYGFPAWITPELFQELTADPPVLRRLPSDPRWGELYEVVRAPDPHLGRSAD